MVKMSYKTKSILFWILTFILTIALAAYQRMTGPTYPVSGEVTIDKTTVNFELLRSHGGLGDAPVKIIIPENADIDGYLAYRRYKSYDKWDTIPMKHSGNTFSASIPHQPPAGKVQYNVILEHNEIKKNLVEEPVIIRFKGAVPSFVLIPHIILMFLAMLFSARTGLEALIRGKRTFLYTKLTLFTLIPGGLILGPIIQEYAFGQLWTGWPVSNDLTDNKTLIAFVFWIIAFIIQFRNRDRKGWALAASIILLVVYLIPHSVMGSEIDHREKENAKANILQTENTH
ncbi:MAG: hypothetical protein K9H84_00425 [Bacteroidales bacterium]|nr:hypothetical protein [Bacteroidales bacterium]